MKLKANVKDNRASTQRVIERLPASYKTLKPGLHGDGGNLYLQVSDGHNGNRRRSWIFRYQLPGRKRRDMGLGSLSDIALPEAREIARNYRRLVKQGIDPIDERNKKIAQNLAASAAVLTFDQATEAQKGVDRHSKRRAIRELESLGLIRVTRRLRKSPEIVVVIVGRNDGCMG
jgi:hypothetical protein